MKSVTSFLHVLLYYYILLLNIYKYDLSFVIISLFINEADLHYKNVSKSIYEKTKRLNNNIFELTCWNIN